MDGGVDPHRYSVRVLVRDLLIHLKEVAVLLPDDVHTDALDGVFEIEIDRQAAVADAAPFVGRLFRVSRGDVAWHEVAKRWVLALEIIIAVVFGDLVGRSLVALLLWHPDAAVV